MWLKGSFRKKYIKTYLKICHLVKNHYIDKKIIIQIILPGYNYGKEQADEP